MVVDGAFLGLGAPAYASSSGQDTEILIAGYGNPVSQLMKRYSLSLSNMVCQQREWNTCDSVHHSCSYYLLKLFLGT